MSIIGCDLHSRCQVVAYQDEAGEAEVRRLEREGEEVRKLYAQWQRGTVLGMKATFPACGQSGCWRNWCMHCG
jgi:hypothetical protein